MTGERGSFCPLINADCKGHICYMWREFSCQVGTFLVNMNKKLEDESR